MQYTAAMKTTPLKWEADPELQSKFVDKKVGHLLLAQLSPITTSLVLVSFQHLAFISNINAVCFNFTDILITKSTRTYFIVGRT